MSKSVLTRPITLKRSAKPTAGDVVGNRKAGKPAKTDKAPKADKGGRAAKAPAAASVNLLSPWVFEAIATRRLRRRFIAAGCVLALLVGAGWGVQTLRAMNAQQRLDVEQAESTRLAAQTQELAPVKLFVGAVEHQKATVGTAMANEVSFSGVLDALALATPNRATLTSAAITVSAPPVAAAGAPAAPVASGCPGPDPFNTLVVVGCITLSGTASDRLAVGDLVVNLGSSKMFVEPFINTTASADGKVTFTGSVGLSEKAFTGEYADMDALLGTAKPDAATTDSGDGQ